MSKITNYVKESYDELMHKVSWPTMSELNNSTIVVFVASLIIAMIIFFMDIVSGVHPTLMWKGVLGYLYSMMA
ncbi:MAG: preprotein translocase subunit SecE [Bacteroidales bacterium]|jgi:preprotein translocase subunit SecE|nr:preprotein translocase subunit SecE [Bacteroidales bacterium]MDD3724701.1 preprotein translocase subunit SecE [Bacteroidales bacterium]MDD4544497.1 preprotein translocase subunit SecE [Bacteroidales bacterium]MDY0053060.1 preprotein translocase subunit SecE [Bacteroidales bacterium]